MREMKMRAHDENGLLITFCGLDGCGKTTMIQKVKKYLEEHKEKVCLTKQPTDFVRQSQIFRTYMDQEDHNAFDYRSLSLLAASDRVQHSNKYIIECLQNSNIVLSDRYFYSCLANLRARGYKKDTWIYDVAKCIPKPDLAFFFDVPVDTAVKRVRSRKQEKNRYIDMDLQYKLKDEYLNIANANGGIVIKTNISEKETFSIVIEKVLACLKNKKKDCFNGVYKVLKKLTDSDAFTNKSSLNKDLGMDSLAHVMLMIELETAFGITFEEDDLNTENLITVSDVVNLVQKYVRRV